MQYSIDRLIRKFNYIALLLDEISSSDMPSSGQNPALVFRDHSSVVPRRGPLPAQLIVGILLQGLYTKAQIVRRFIILLQLVLYFYNC